MKIYELSYHHDEGLRCQIPYEYFPSLRDAKKARTRVIRETKDNDPMIKVINFKPTKKEIIRLLNRAGSSD